MWHRRFLFLWAGQTLANLGDIFYIVAFISVVYAVSGSVMYTAFVPVVILSAQSVSGLTAPLLFRRLSLPSMLVLSQALKTCLLAAAAVLVDRTAGTNGQAIWLLLGLGGLIAFMDGWANPARNALVPQLVEREQLIRANGLLATSDQTVHFAGWAAGGLLVAFLGASAVLWGTVAAYVLASLAMLAIKPEKAAPDMAVVEPPQENWLTGWKAIRDVPLLRQLVALDVVMGVHLREKNILPIHDQRHVEGGFTAVADDYDEVTEAVLAHDFLIFSTPIYWYGMSGYMKNYVDRWSQSLRDKRYAFKESLGRKQAYVITTGGDQPRIKGLPLIQQFQYVFSFVGMPYAGYIIGEGNQPGDVLADMQAVASAKQLNAWLKTEQ